MNRKKQFEDYFESYKLIYKNTHSDEEIAKLVNWKLDKEESYPKSETYILVEYYNSLIDVEEIEEFREAFQDKGIELGHYNKTGDIYASVDMSEILIRVSESFVVQVAAKTFLAMCNKIHQGIKDKEVTIRKGQEMVKRKASFEIISTDPSTDHTIHCKLEGEFNDAEMKKLIEKVPNIISASVTNEDPSSNDLPIHFRPNKDNTDWEQFDLLEQIINARKNEQASVKKSNEIKDSDS